MKIISALLALLFALTAADMPQLRTGTLVSSWSKKKGSTPNTGRYEYIGATVHIGHVGEHTNKAKITDALVNAYNKVHTNTKFLVTDAFVERSVPIPEDDGAATEDDGSVMVTEYCWAILTYWCEDCSDETGGHLLPPLALTSGGVSEHAQFEDTFCSALRDSGDLALVAARDCTVDFTYSAAKSQDMMLGKNKKSNSGKSGGDDEQKGQLGSEIQVSHVSGTGNDQEHVYDQTLVSDAYTTAFNQVYQGSGFVVDSVQLRRAIDIPEDDAHFVLAAEMEPTPLGGKCTRCRYYYRDWITVMDFRCRLCGNGDDDDAMMLGAGASADTSTTVMNAEKHKAFEAVFCNELKKNGGVAYAEIQDCKISYSYHYSQDVTTVAIKN